MSEESGENRPPEAPTVAQNPQVGAWAEAQPPPGPAPTPPGPDQTQAAGQQAPGQQPPAQSQTSGSWGTPTSPLPPLQPPPLQPPPIVPGPAPLQPPAPAPMPGQYMQPGPAPAPDQYMQQGPAPAQDQFMPPGYSGAYAVPLPGQTMAYGAEQPPPKRRLPRWMIIGIPILVIVLAAGGYGVVRLLSSPNPDVTKVRCQAGNLASCLVAAPGSASVDTSSWAKSVSVSDSAYATQFADAAEQEQPEVGSIVAGDGVKTIVHRDWTFGSDQVDIILLQFHTIQGAKSWAQDRDGEFVSIDSGPQLAVTGDSTAKAYTSSSPNSSGDYVAHYITTVGNVDLEIHYASQGSLQQQNFEQWASTEYASLQTTATPAPDPSPTPTTFQSATCPGATLTNCLMPMPTGSVAVPGLPSTYTDDSYATAEYTGAGIPDVEQTLSTDQVTSIIAESFATDSFANASQVVLLQTRTDAQAENLLTTLGGSSLTFPETFTVPGYPSADASYSTVDTTGENLLGGLVSAQAGNIYLTMWFTFANSFDIATAQSWATTELNLLTAHTQSHWGFPIPTVSVPALTPFASDSCTASALTGCLMSLPSGAKANTAAGANPQDPGVDGYTDALYSSKSGYEQTWLNTDGATDVASESWTAPDGASATDYLLRFGSGRQAEAAALQQAGDDLVGAQSCTASSIPDTYCVVMPQNDSNGQVPLLVFGWGAKYGFALQVSKADGADTADALKWAEVQAELLAG